MINITHEVNKKDEEGNTLLHIELEKSHFELDTIKFLIENTTDVNAENDYGMIPLVCASQINAIDVMKLLLTKEGTVIDIEDGQGMTPLYWAVINNDVKIAELLIKKGASVDYSGINSTTALIEASKHGHIDIVKLLVANGADINIKVSVSRTPLHYAAEKGYMDIAKILVENGADINADDGEGMTPLHYAAKESNIDIVSFLIEKRADLNYKSRNGEVALKYPYDKDDETMVEFMLENGANEKSMYDNDLNFIEHAEAYKKSKQWFIDIVRSDPEVLVKLLNEFSSDTLAFTNHKQEAMTYENFMQKVKDGWNVIDKSLKRQAPILHSNIDKFFFSEELGKKDTKGKVISWGEGMTIGFSSPDIKRWCEDGYPLLEYDEEDNLEHIMTNDFKNLIVIKDLESMIKTIAEECNLKVEKCEINIDKIFTDVLEFKKLIKAIFAEIKKASKKKMENGNPINIKVTATNQDTDKFIEIKIIHIGSESPKSAKAQMEMGGDFKNIKKISQPICYWSIDIICPDNYRYLIDYTFPKKEIGEDHCRRIKNTTEGFTYILRFVK